jgi:hypothetical protein
LRYTTEIGTARAIFRARRERLRFVARGIVIAQHRLALEQVALAREHLVLVPGARRDEAFVDEAETLGVPLGIRAGMRRIHRLVELQVVRLVGPEVGEPETQQALVALDQHPELLEDFALLEHHARPVGDDLLPVLLRGIRLGRAHQPEIAPLVVGADEELVTAMVDVVLVALAPRDDGAELAFGLVRAQDPDVRRVLAGDAEHEMLFASRVAHVDVEVLVVFLVDERVRGIAQAHAVELVAALGGLVLLDIEERAVVGRPGGGGHAHRGLAREAARGEILHVHRVLAVTHEVHRVCEPGRIGTDLHEPDGAIRVAMSQRVHVEHHFLGCIHGALAPAVDGVLQAFDLAHVVPVAVAAVRNALVGLLDAGEHLRVERLAEARERLHRRLRVAILRVEVRDDLRDWTCPGARDKDRRAGRRGG